VNFQVVQIWSILSSTHDHKTTIVLAKVLSSNIVLDLEGQKLILQCV